MPRRLILTTGVYMENDTIKEAELVDNLNNKTVVRFKLVQGIDLKYNVFVQLTWKGGDLLLYTQRKKPRVWASLDRFVTYAQRKYRYLPVVELHLWRPKNEKKINEDSS